MNTCPICNKHREPVQFFINYAPDEKLAFVERVCGLLIQSRYGVDRVYEQMPSLRCGIDDDPPDAFFAEVTTFTAPRVTGMLWNLVEKIKLTASLSTKLFKNSGTQSRSPSTLGRGSPDASRC